MKKWICVIVSLVFLFTNAVSIYATEVESTENMGDEGINVVEDFETSHSATTPAKVTAELLVPEGFGQSCYVILMDENGTGYRISCTESNEYMSSIYLAEGNYFVDYVGVYGDNISQFSFDFTQEQIIEAKSGETNVLTYTLLNFDEIEQEIADNITQAEGEQTEIEVEAEEMVFFPSGVDGILIDGNGGTYYEVTHAGTTKVKCTVTGNATADADVVMRVVKGGVIGEAVIELSKDGGATYDVSAVIDDVLYIGTLGLSVAFTMENDAEQFQEGDTFSFMVRENFRVTYNSSMYDGYVTIFGHPLEDQKLLIRMLSSGGRGSSRFTVSYDLGNTIAIQDIVPENGQYQLADGLTLIFSDSTFAKGLEYSVEIASNDTSMNWMPVYLLVIVLAVLVTAGYVYLMNKKDKPNEYRINVYMQMGEEKDYG